MNIWLQAFVIVMSITAYAFTIATIIWLKKFRTSVVKTLGEMTEQQLSTSHLVSEALTKLQKQQRLQEQGLRKLTEAHMALRHDLGTISVRLENNERQVMSPPEPRILH